MRLTCTLRDSPASYYSNFHAIKSIFSVFYAKPLIFIFYFQRTSKKEWYTQHFFHRHLTLFHFFSGLNRIFGINFLFYPI